MQLNKKIATDREIKNTDFNVTINEMDFDYELRLLDNKLQV